MFTCTLPSFGNGGWGEPSDELISPSAAFLNENETSLYEESFDINLLAETLNNGVAPSNPDDDLPPPSALPVGSGMEILVMAVLAYLLVVASRQKAESRKDC